MRVPLVPPARRLVRPLVRVAGAAGFAALCLARIPQADFLVEPAHAAQSAPSAQPAQACTADAGITLPPGFCATIFADNVGHARQMAVGADGTLYVNTWSGRYFKENIPPDGGYALALKDTKGTGKADAMQRFGPGPNEGGHGGSGVALYHHAVYIESNDRILRYPLQDSEIAPKGQGEVVVSGLPLTGDHPMHPFFITPQGDLLVDLGSATNACEQQNRTPHSPGNQPCEEKKTRGGIWRYDANGTNQRFSPAERYASGIRNGEGIAMDGAGRLFSTQHGRDQLHEDWPEHYTAREGQELPAEEIVALKKGADYGWPECYFDGTKKKLMLAPEYGGDGNKVGLCSGRTAPVAFFPGHWAPNDLEFYTASGANAFPHAWQGGAFVAFHGSWNRAPGPQGGYNVVFQPFSNGRASGPYLVFADGFAGAVKEPGQAAFRPSGLAVAPDGALFISDDVHGRIWRVTYRGGNPNAPLAAAPAPGPEQSNTHTVLPPEGIHPDAGRQPANLPVPPGATRDQVALGERVFHGETSSAATCSGCHGTDGKGSALGADLTAGHYLWSDGSLGGIQQTVANGVPQPKEHTGVMPPMGGVKLSTEELKAVAAYVWALGHSH